MSTSRRFFLKAGTLAALSAGFALKSAPSVFGSSASDSQGFSIPATAQQDLLMSYNRSTFEPYVNSIFQAPDATGRLIELTLISIKTYGPVRRTKLRRELALSSDSECFGLMFRSTSPLPQFTSIHRMRHAALGIFDIFLSPREKDGTYFYEAVFNRSH